MKKKGYLITSFIGGIALMGLLLVLFQNPEVTQGSAPSGLQASNIPATSSALTLAANTATTLFEAKLNCSGRSISADATALKISFGSSTPSSLVGSALAASSEKYYDGGQYGCGQWTGFATASSTVTLHEFN